MSPASRSPLNDKEPFIPPDFLVKIQRLPPHLSQPFWRGCLVFFSSCTVMVKPCPLLSRSLFFRVHSGEGPRTNSFHLFFRGVTDTGHTRHSLSLPLCKTRSRRFLFFFRNDTTYTIRFSKGMDAYLFRPEGKRFPFLASGDPRFSSSPCEAKSSGTGSLSPSLTS